MSEEMWLAASWYLVICSPYLFMVTFLTVTTIQYEMEYDEKFKDHTEVDLGTWVIKEDK